MQTSIEQFQNIQAIPKIKRVALYERVSTEEQAREGKYGMKVQDDLLKKYCESQGFDFDESRIYRDEGFSGSLAIEDRPALDRLFEDAKAKQFDLVVVYRLDRFFRDNTRFLNAIKELLKIGVGFKSATESFDTDTPNGRLILQILGSLAEHEKEVIRERMSKGKEQAAKTGKWVTGVPPYGYRVDKETKKLVICEEEAKVVKQMYDWLVREQCSLREIVRRATELKFPAPKHATIRKRKTYNVWWKRTVNRILINEVYTGEFYYRKYKRPFGYLSSVAEGKGLRPKEDWIKIEVPALVSRDMHDQAVRQLQRNKENAARNTKRQYLYGHLIYDGRTGKRLGSGYQAPKKNPVSPSLGRYYHSAYHRSDSPDAPRVQCAETRLNPIWDCLVSILSDPENTLPRLEEYTFKQSNQRNIEQKLQDLQTQIATLKEREQRIAYAFIEGGFDEKSYKGQLVECRKRIGDLENEHSQCQQLLMKRAERKDRNIVLKRLFKQVKERLENPSYEDKRYILRLFIERISLFPEKNYAEVFFKFPGNISVPQTNRVKRATGDSVSLALHVKILSEKERRREKLLETPGMNHAKNIDRDLRATSL